MKAICRRTVWALMTAGVMASCNQGAKEEWSTTSGTATRGDGGSRLGAMPMSSAVDAAVGVLETSAESPNPQIRAHAIEGLHAAPELLEAYARAGLIDENRGVRFVAAMTIGKFQFKQSLRFVQPLLHDPSDSVHAAAIYALRVCGEPVDINPLAGFLRSPDPEVRANAALILGELGEPSAAPMVQQAVGKPLELASSEQAKVVDLQLAEALCRLGELGQVHTIRGALFLPPEQQEITAIACLMLGKMKDRGSIGSLQRLITAEGDERRAAEVRLAAAAGLAQLGEPVPVEVALEYVNHPRAEIRHQAAMTLGFIRSAGVAQPLQRLLADEDALVRVAAAAAILRLDRG